MIVRSTQRYIREGRDDRATSQGNAVYGVTSRRCVEARPMNARRRRTGRKVRRDHGSDLKNSRKGRKKKKKKRWRKEERGVKRREKERGKAGEPQAYEDSHTDSSPRFFARVSLSSFREAFRHACKFLKSDTFPCGTFER